MRKTVSNSLLFVLKMGVFSVLISLVYSWLLSLIEYSFSFKLDKTGVEDLSPLAKVIIASILAPIVETFLFQKLVYDFFSSRQRSRFWMILTSSVMFGLTHLYSIVYAIGAGLIGVLLIYAYIIWDEERRISKFLIVCMIHAFHNIFFLSLEALMFT